MRFYLCIAAATSSSIPLISRSATGMLPGGVLRGRDSRGISSAYAGMTEEINRAINNVNTAIFHVFFIPKTSFCFFYINYTEKPFDLQLQISTNDLILFRELNII